MQVLRQKRRVTCRTQSGACDRRPRRCVRLLGRSTTFPSASPLPSPCSAGPCGRPLCAGFCGTLGLSDSLHPCITGVPHAVHRADLAGVRQARCRASRVPHTVWPCMPEVSDPARSVSLSPKHGRQCCLPRVRSASAPRTRRFRGSILCLHLPLSTLRASRYREPRMTRGQRGWRDLRCRGLAPLPLCRLFPAHPNAGAQPLLEAEATQERRL